MKEITEAGDQQLLLASRTLSTRVGLRSELAQEIIANKPNFMERWALLIFMGLLLIILAATWFIKYPDIIETRAILAAQNSPKEIITKQEGHLIRLFVSNNTQVEKNETIGWIESTASHEEVSELVRQIDTSISLLNLGGSDKVANCFTQHYANLGELQPAYQQFMTAWQAFNDYMINGFISRKKTIMINDVNSLDTSKSLLQSQKILTEKDLQLAEESYNMNKLLYDSSILSKDEFRAQLSKYVNKELALPQLNNNILENETQKRNKLKEIDQLNHDAAQQELIFRQMLQSLKSQVEEWMKKFMLRAPIAGKVVFIIPLEENRYLQAGRLLGYINPPESNFYAETTLSQQNFGKIDTGLTVQLRFDAYPYQELGFVEGKLNYISSIPSDSGFLATIRLTNGLMTNDRRLLVCKTGLKAQAVIITKNMRLLERLYYNLVKSTSVGNK